MLDPDRYFLPEERSVGKDSARTAGKAHVRFSVEHLHGGCLLYRLVPIATVVSSKEGRGGKSSIISNEQPSHGRRLS